MPTQFHHQIAQAFVLVALVLVPALSARAQALPSPPADVALAYVPESNISTNRASAASSITQTARPPGATLTVLELAYASLQTLDLVSTLHGLNHGRSEANPLMRGAGAHPAGITALKIGGAASTLLLVHRIARHNRVAAIVTMAAVNSVYSVVVARNLQTLSRR